MTITCQHCGAENSSRVIFCATCGYNTHWTPKRQSEGSSLKDTELTEASSGQPWFVITAILAGIVFGFMAFTNIGNVMWGNSPYNEGTALWSADNSGRSRYGDVGSPTLVAFTFGFMFASVPLAGCIGAAGRAAYHLRCHILSALVCTGAYLAGHFWWQETYAKSLGFPQYILDSKQIYAGYEALTTMLLQIAFGSGVLTLLIGIALRFAHRKPTTGTSLSQY